MLIDATRTRVIDAQEDGHRFCLSNRRQCQFLKCFRIEDFWPPDHRGAIRIDAPRWIEPYLTHHTILALAIVYDPSEAGTVGRPGNSPIDLLIEAGDKTYSIGPNPLRRGIIAIEALIDGGTSRLYPVPPAIGNDNAIMPAERAEFTINGEILGVFALPVCVCSRRLPEMRECKGYNNK